MRPTGRGGWATPSTDAPPEAKPEPRHDHARPKRHGRDKPEKPERAKPEPAAAVDATAVLGRFRDVTREYKAFKQSFGSRLEKEWADLATFAQFARSDEGKLRALDKKIDRFRGQMKAAQ